MGRAQEGFSESDHDWHAPDYVAWWIARDGTRDNERRQRLRAMLSHAGRPRDAALAVIDVGGGYGVLTEEVLAAYPRARVTLLDYSQPMLAEAGRRLGSRADRVGFVLADLSDPEWPSRAGGPFDLAVSAIAIHNLRDPALIAGCYRGVCRVLAPGALFLDYDLFFDAIGGLAGNIRMLQEAGFARVACLFQYPPAAALAASMP